MSEHRSLWRRLASVQGAALGVVLIVAIIVAVARLLPHSTTAPLAVPGTATLPSPVISLDDGGPSAVPSGSLLHSPVPPAVAHGGTTPQTVARRFATAWLHHDGVSASGWLTAVTAYTTKTVASQLALTDPANVPAERITGAVTVVGDTRQSCEVHVPTDAGTLVLTMQADGTSWQVAGVDWDPS